MKKKLPIPLPCEHDTCLSFTFTLIKLIILQSLYILTIKACPMVGCKKYYVQTWDLTLQVGLGHVLVTTWLSKNDDDQGKSLLKLDKKKLKGSKV
jgi:hypothetical protein